MEKRSHREADQGIVYCSYSLSMRKFGTFIFYGGRRERWTIVMDRWWGHVAGTRSVIEMIPPSQNFDPDPESMN